MSLDSPAKQLTCAVMITTHNRLEDLQHTCNQLRNLDPAPDEWLFTADGCEDGTAAWLKQEFPDATLFVNNPGQGSVASRDQMLRKANSDLVLALDDDSYPCEINAIERLKVFHASAPAVAVSTFPQRSEEYPETLEQECFPELGETGSFPNSGACFVTKIYCTLPGFPRFFFHAFEEPDYVLQCIEAGYRVFHSNRVTIRHHFTSVGRDERRTHHRHARNECWSVLMRCPMPWMPLVLFGKALSQLRYSCRRGGAWLIREPAWWYQAALGTLQALSHRRPVSWNSYRTWLTAMKNIKRGSI